MNEPSLFEPYEKGNIQERFERFHQAHPEVFAFFRRLALQVRSRGWKHYSADAICHQIRWHHRVERGERDFKLNDHFTSRYARLLIAADPSFATFFEIRILKTE